MNFVSKPDQIKVKYESAKLNLPCRFSSMNTMLTFSLDYESFKNVTKDIYF